MSTWRKAAIAGAILVTVGIVLLLTLCGVNNTETDVRVPANSADLHPDEYAALQSKYGDVLSTRSLVSPASDDSTDFVLKGEGLAVPDETLISYRGEIFTNPTVGDMLIRGLMELQVPSGETVGSLNPWMAEFVEKSSDDLMSWAEKNTSSNTLHVSAEYQKYAFNTILLLDRLSNQGIQTDRTAAWHYPLNALQVSGLPRTFKSDERYDGEFIVLSYTEKEQECPFWSIGINTADGRLAFLESRCGDWVTTAAEAVTTLSPPVAAADTPAPPSTNSTPPTTEKPPTKLTPKDASRLVPQPEGYTPAPAPAGPGESTPPSGSSVTNQGGTTTVVTPANPSTKPSAPAPDVPAPGANPNPKPAPEPAPRVEQAPESTDPGGSVGDPGALP